MTLTIGKEAGTLTTHAGRAAGPSTALVPVTAAPPTGAPPGALPLRASGAAPPGPVATAEITPTTAIAGTAAIAVVAAGGRVVAAAALSAVEPRPSACPLSARVELWEEGAVIHLSGLLVASAASAARSAVARAAALGQREIIVDLAGVRDADPLGAVLLGAMSRHATRCGSRLRLRNAGPRVRQALDDRGVRVELLGPLG
ncbi:MULTISPECIES: STAS domain-containing protein [unclassified Parafrankia]|uniref:STAS domain-containing protein n=1 Tax=unclassified Parafrankia TaxID=2994368 RepID=UPI000DA53462|nr:MULTISPECIES: STAS domain-containing protein [unclassified Parafrankia]TCJ35176.1 STAS domain-containing protein [Parafrankia sp. BMG5.11]SQD94136.1 Anti-sigma-factor antagonist [Parafrankia sp. Ea1.12]